MLNKGALRLIKDEKKMQSMYSQYFVILDSGKIVIQSIQF